MNCHKAVRNETINIRCYFARMCMFVRLPIPSFASMSVLRLFRNFLTFRNTWVHPRVLVGSCYAIFSVMCMFCRWLFVLLCFFFWPLCCLFFFDIRILITTVVSSSSSSSITFYDVSEEWTDQMIFWKYRKYNRYGCLIL